MDDFMSIITDGKHLVSDNSQFELHLFATKMGLKLEWFQNHPRHPHYDLTTHGARARAYANGAELVSSRELIHRMRGVRYGKSRSH